MRNTDDNKDKPISRFNRAPFPVPEQIREEARQKARSIKPPDLDSMNHEEILHMVYEMQVKQIEADLQVKHLRSQHKERDYQAELFSIVTQNMLDMVSLTDMEGNFIFAGKSHEILGYEPGFLIGKNVMDFVHPEDFPQILDEFGEFVASGHPRRVEYRCRCKDGTYLWLETIGNFLGDESGIPQRIVFNSRDITERKQAEKAIENERAYLSAVIDNIGEAIVICDAEGQITRFNETARRLHGMPEKPVPPDQWALHYDLYQEDGITPLPKEGNPLFRALQGERVQNAGIVVAPKHSHPYFLVCNGQALTDESGKINGAVVAMHDITERKKAEEELAKNKIFLESIFNSIQDGLSILDSELNIKYTNPVMEQWYAENMPLVGKKCYACYHNNDKPCNPCPTLRCFESGEIESDYVPGLPGSAVEWIELFSHPMKNTETGDIIGAIEFVRDITEQKQAEKEKEKLQAQLRQSQKMEAIGTLAGGIAHDFNNILSSVLGYTELSLEEIEKGTLLHQNLSQVLIAGNRAKDLVKQILVFGRKEEQKFIPTPIAPLVKEALKMLRSTFPSSIEIRENISIEQGIVYADPTQLHQVIVNLSTNAKQAMSDEGGILEVSLETVSFDENIGKKYPDMAAGNYLRISVSDTGCGISEQYLDNIFEPYFTTSKTGTGSGLGLSVAHGIVTAQNGHITVYSEPGKGTTFHVYLPLAEQQRSPAVSIGQEEEALPTGTEKVLIVDDEKPIVEVQRQNLEGLGYRVTPQTSSVEALEAFRANTDKFDIVITDMTMPNMTGDRLALRIKEIRPDVPVILCTGFSEKINDQKKGELGIEGYMLKPVTKTELAKTVRKILDNFVHTSL